MHTQYDIETSIPTFFLITKVRVHDSKVMDDIPYEENSSYIFEGIRLHNIESVEAYSVVRRKKNNDFRPIKWARHFPLCSDILSNATDYMYG